MKYSSQGKQYRLDLFPTTLEKSLDPSNRWYKLAGAIPWEEIERVYNKCLRNKHRGGGNKPVRMIVGALIIKHKMNLSDEETVQIIPENSYMQYFVGIEEFTSKPIFDSSLFVYIRKRLDLETFNDLTLAVMEEEKRREEEAGKTASGATTPRTIRKKRMGRKMTALWMKMASIIRVASRWTPPVVTWR